MIWIIRSIFQWVREYLTLTPNKYDFIVHKFECLLCHATGGKYSKARYALSDMYDMVNDYISECCDKAVAEALKERGTENGR